MKLPSGKWALLFGIVLGIAAFACLAFVYVFALAAAYGSANGGAGGGGDWIALAGLLCGGALGIASLALVLRGLAGIALRPDPRFAMIVFAGASALAYVVSIGALVSEPRDCALRRTTRLCDGPALRGTKRADLRFVGWRKRDDLSSDPEVVRTAVPADAPPWMLTRLLDLRATDAAIHIGARWELLFLRAERPRERRESWTLFARERVDGAQDFAWTATIRPNAFFALSPDELLITGLSRNEPQGYLLRPGARTHERLEMPASEGYAAQLPPSAEMYALPDGTTLFFYEGSSTLLAFRRTPRPRLFTLRAPPAPFGVNGGPRDVMVDVQQNGEYAYTHHVTPPGPRDEDAIVRGRGFTCVGVPSGVCLLPDDDAARAPSLSLRMRGGYDMRTAIGLALVAAHLALVALIVRKRRALRTADELYVDASKRALVALSAIGTLVAIAFGWLFFFV